MNSVPQTAAINNPSLGIAFVLVAVTSISINDMLMKQMSGDYALHQMVFARSLIGIAFSLPIVRFEDGFGILKTRTPGLHLMRGLLVVFSNMAFFTALVTMPLGSVTALFFVAPLCITLLSIPCRGEKVGVRRISAIVLGFGGVLLMLQPWASPSTGAPPLLVQALPIVAAMTYAGMQIMTRGLGVSTKASALAVYIQATFIAISFGFFLAIGDGRYAEGLENENLIFLLRAWTWPTPGDEWLFIALGAISAVIGYCLSAAYRSADAATVTPFEYAALPLAIFWGWLIWGDLPDGWTLAGVALIMGAGLYVFLREKHKQRPFGAKRASRRW